MTDQGGDDDSSVEEPRNPLAQDADPNHALAPGYIDEDPLEANPDTVLTVKAVTAPDRFFEPNGNVAQRMRLTATLAPNQPYRTPIEDGLGIFIMPNYPLHDVVMLPDGTRARFNEPSNRLGKKILGLVMARYKQAYDEYRAAEEERRRQAAEDARNTRRRRTSGQYAAGEARPARTVNRHSEQTAFEEVYFRLQAEVQVMAGYGNNGSEITHTRRAKFYWFIQKAFNMARDHNYMLRIVCIRYCENRLGINDIDSTEETTEIWAMVEAFQELFARSAPHGESWANSAGNGQAWMLGVHLANEHLAHYGVTPVAILPDHTDDIATAAPLRATNTTTIWVNGKLHRVESRPDVRDELVAFLMKYDHNPVHRIPIPDRGAPQNAPPAGPAAPGAVRAVAL